MAPNTYHNKSNKYHPSYDRQLCLWGSNQNQHYILADIFLPRCCNVHVDNL